MVAYFHIIHPQRQLELRTALEFQRLNVVLLGHEATRLKSACLPGRRVMKGGLIFSTVAVVSPARLAQLGIVSGFVQ